FASVGSNSDPVTRSGSKARNRATGVAHAWRNAVRRSGTVPKTGRPGCSAVTIHRAGGRLGSSSPPSSPYERRWYDTLLLAATRAATSGPHRRRVSSSDGSDGIENQPGATIRIVSPEGMWETIQR